MQWIARPENHQQNCGKDERELSSNVAVGRSVLQKPNKTAWINYLQGGSKGKLPLRTKPYAY